MNIKFSSVILVIFLAVAAVSAQTATFTYQGQLNDSSMPANGTYQMQFSLFDAASGGNQTGATITNSSVAVVNGVFTVQLNFSPATPFASGANRYLQIAVKKPAEADYTPLAPRQQITSVPYSIRTLSASAADSLSSACAACVTSAQIASLDGAKVTGNTITNINASNVASGTLDNARLSGNVTLQGNTFNGANQLVKLDANAKLPAVDGSQLTNVSASSSPGGIAVFSASSGSTYTLASSVGNSATRSFFPSFGGNSGSGVTITITMPPANTYPAGTVLRVYATDYTSAAPAVLFQRSGSTSDLLHGFNQGSGVAGPVSFGGALQSWTTDGVSNWYRGN